MGITDTLRGMITLKGIFSALSDSASTEIDVLMYEVCRLTEERIKIIEESDRVHSSNR